MKSSHPFYVGQQCENLYPNKCVDDPAKISIDTTGLMGPYGPSGESSTTGYTGYNGQQGPIGTPSNDSYVGYNGYIGPTGQISITGPTGPTNTIGYIGNQGAIGETGEPAEEYIGTQFQHVEISDVGPVWKFSNYGYTRYDKNTLFAEYVPLPINTTFNLYLLRSVNGNALFVSSTNPQIYYNDDNYGIMYFFPNGQPALTYVNSNVSLEWYIGTTLSTAIIVHGIAKISPSGVYTRLTKQSVTFNFSAISFNIKTLSTDAIVILLPGERVTHYIYTEQTNVSLRLYNLNMNVFSLN